MPHAKNGLFITFEGGEGAGKTSQINQVGDWLRKRGLEVVTTREPGGTPVADRIRKTLLDSKEPISPETELFLYETARRDHVAAVIRPALRRGAIVLCDRFTDATIAYQAYGRGLSLKVVSAMNEIATGGLKPTLTFLLDLPAETGLQRARKRKRGLDRLEKEAKTFHEKVRAGYLTLARKDKKRIRKIDAARSRDKIFSDIRRELEKIL